MFRAARTLRAGGRGCRRLHCLGRGKHHARCNAAASPRVVQGLVASDIKELTHAVS